MANRQNQHQARQAFRTAMRSILIGPRNSSLLDRVPSLRNSVQAADQQYQQFLVNFVSHLSASLTEDENQIWITARNNVAAKEPKHFRYVPDLSATQNEQPKTAARKRIDDAQMASIIRTDQAITANVTKQQCRRSLSSVVKTQNQILPLPWEMVTDQTTEGELQ